MKIKITEEIAGKVVIRDTIIKLNVNPFDSEGSKIPLAIFEHKGDILVADAVASPEVVPVGNDGQVLVADSSESTGVKWKTVQLGTITLVNSESSAIPSGTVVTNGDTSGTFRIATSADTTNLYVTSENISAGDDGVLYAVSGISCNVRVTADAVEIGDSLIVSSTNGVAEADEGSGFATAVTAKAAGAVGTVTCVLVNTMVSTLTVPEGGQGRVSLTENALLAGDGTDPVKMIESSAGYLYSSGSGALPAYKSIAYADITGTPTINQLFTNASLNTVNIDTTFNYNYTAAISEAGHGTLPTDSTNTNGWYNVTNFYTNHFAVQLLQQVSWNTVAGVSPYETWIRSRHGNDGLYWSQWSRFIKQDSDKWYLPTGILSSNCIAAYRFKGASSEANALLNLNNTATYPLTKVGDTVTWNQSTGFFIPATNGYGLHNASITSFTSVFVRYSDVDNTSALTSLIAPSEGHILMAKCAWRVNDSQTQYNVAPGVWPNAGYYSPTYKAAAVLGYIKPTNTLYIDGVSTSMTYIDTGGWSPTYILIGEAKYSSFVGNLSASKIQAVAFYNTQLTAAQAVQLSTAMAAL